MDSFLRFFVVKFYFSLAYPVPSFLSRLLHAQPLGHVTSKMIVRQQTNEPSLKYQRKCAAERRREKPKEKHEENEENEEKEKRRNEESMTVVCDIKI